MGDEGVYIDQKLSELLKVSVGDTFFLDGDVRGDVTVAASTSTIRATSSI